MKRPQRVEFDRGAAIRVAWDFLWADNLKDRDGRDYRGRSYYLTASDVEDQVRMFAAETLAGEKWGTRGRACGKPWDSPRFSGDLLQQVRRWLQEEQYRGRLLSHNFGRGHISGQRYRPAGQPVGPAEAKTIVEKKARAGRTPPVHLSKGQRFYCSPAKLSPWGRSQARRTIDRSLVTCTRCLKLSTPTTEKAS